MATILDHFNRARQLTATELSKEIFGFVKTISEYLAQMNRDQINKESEDVYGEAIGFYSKATEILSDGAKRAGQPFTGKDTGDWLKGFYVKVSNDMLFFGSTDPKDEIIKESDNWISHDLHGLTDENLQKAIDDKFLPFVQQHSRKTLGI